MPPELHSLPASARPAAMRGGMLSGGLQCLLCCFAASETDGHHVLMWGSQAAMPPGQCLQQYCIWSACCSISARVTQAAISCKHLVGILMASALSLPQCWTHIDQLTAGSPHMIEMNCRNFLEELGFIFPSAAGSVERSPPQ